MVLTDINLFGFNILESIDKPRHTVNIPEAR